MHPLHNVHRHPELCLDILAEFAFVDVVVLWDAEGLEPLDDGA